jgi:hypothetical protein
MREDEYHSRRFMLFMRRVFVLAAVAAAVPVVMWGITGVVRNFLGQPQVLSIQTITATPVAATPDQTASIPTDNPPAAPAQDSRTAQLPAAPAVNAANSPPIANGGNAGPAVTITSSAPPAASSVPTAANPPAVPPAPKPAPAAPAKLAMSNPAASPPANPAPSAAPFAPVPMPNDIWPAPPAMSAPPTASGPPAAPEQVPLAAIADDPPQSEPIAGKVPLPRKRPPSFIIARGGVPLPRPRPMAVAAATLGADETPASPFDWLRNLFQSSSPAAATTEPQQNLVAH